MKIHANWLAQEKPTPRVGKEKPVRHGIEPLLCESCKRDFIPANGQQVYCAAPNCVRNRAAKRQQERRRLQQMMADAERKKKKKYDSMAKAQITEVKRAFRETRRETA